MARRQQVRSGVRNRRPSCLRSCAASPLGQNTQDWRGRYDAVCHSLQLDADTVRSGWIIFRELEALRLNPLARAHTVRCARRVRETAPRPRSALSLRSAAQCAHAFFSFHCASQAVEPGRIWIASALFLAGTNAHASCPRGAHDASFNGIRLTRLLQATGIRCVVAASSRAAAGSRWN